MLFVSHSWNDIVRLQPLVKQLNANGILTWFDQDEVHLADAIPAKMSDGLERADKLLVGWSAGANKSQHVRNELDAFYIRKPEPGPILFLRLDDTPVPTLYAARRYLNFRGQQEEADAIVSWADDRPPTQSLPVMDFISPETAALNGFRQGPMVGRYGLHEN